MKYSKHFGRTLKDRDSIKKALETLFTQGGGKGGEGKKGKKSEDRSQRIKARHHTGNIRNRVIMEFRWQLKKLVTWFKDNDVFTFYSSSILFVYEGDEMSDSFDNCRLRAIDFAHVVEREERGRDDGYLDGLYTILRLLEDILQQQEKMGKLREDL